MAHDKSRYLPCRSPVFPSSKKSEEREICPGQSFEIFKKRKKPKSLDLLLPNEVLEKEFTNLENVYVTCGRLQFIDFQTNILRHSRQDCHILSPNYEYFEPGKCTPGVNPCTIQVFPWSFEKVWCNIGITPLFFLLFSRYALVQFS